MLVSHHDDYDTHAVVGGNGVQALAIAQTAEFFTVLSDTLYSNKPRAVIREVLCNAWDAHIVSGRTDKHVKTEIKDDQLIIRDFGYGIAPADMHKIYCVYGASTKQNDGNQTGGFGLGSKAPFAYSDHFTVTTHHKGTKTVYAISRGSSMTDGRPDMRVMVQVPTDQEGLEVSIPVKSAEDARTFRKLIEEIASFGEMNVTVNGTKVKTISLGESNEGIYLTPAIDDYKNRVKIRYGNVIYQVNDHPEIAGNLGSLLEILRDMPRLITKDNYRLGHGWECIMQAPSNSISVTPSRESLSMTETTVATLNRLMSDLISKIELDSKLVQAKIKELHSRAIDRAYMVMRPELLLTSTNLIADMITTHDVKEVPAKVLSTETAALFWAAGGGGKMLGNKDGLHKNQIEIAIQNGFPRSYDLRKFLTQRIYDKPYSDLFKKLFVQPLSKKLAMHETLSPKSMFVRRPYTYGGDRTAFIHFGKFNPQAFDDQLAMLTARVVVSYSKRAIDEHIDLIKRRGAKGVNLQLCYVPTRRKGHKAAAIAFFKKLGFTVFDLDAEIEDKGLEVSVDVSYTPKAPKKIGLPTLENLLSENTKSFTAKGHLFRERRDESLVIRNENPKCVFLPYRLADDKFFHFGDSGGKYVVNLIGGDAGIARSQTQHDKWVKDGCKDGNEYLAELVTDKVLNDPDIMDYQSVMSVLYQMSDIDYMIRICHQSPKIAKAIKLPKKPEGDTAAAIYIFDHMAQDSRHVGPQHPDWMKGLKNAKKKIDELALQRDKELMTLKSRIVTNPYFDAIELRVIARIFDDNPKKDVKDFYEALILRALK